MISFPRLVAAFSALLLALSPVPPAAAQGYPVKPVKVIVPHPTGGGPVDGPARGVADALGKALGQPFVIENRDGADGIIGMEALVKSAPDGYTLAVTSASVVTMNELTRVSLPYNSARDLAPVAYFGAIQSLLLVHPSVPAKTLQELIEMAKAKPNSVSWGTLGTTSNGPLLIGLFKKDYGAGFYMIPYKSTIQALQGTVAGDVNVVAYAAGGAVNLVKAGKLRAIAYTGDKRHAALPDVPTFAEVGVKLAFRTWIGMFAPSATPRDIVQKLNAETVRVLSDPGFTQKFIDSQGIETSEVTRGSAEQFAQFIKADRQAYEEAVKAAGIEKK
jgi:tripartite-type tricarboxylate transporter receptor subunit TctC